MGRKGGGSNKGKPSPNTVAKIEAREALRKKIEADLEPLYLAWRDSAIGHYMLVESPDGERKIYKKAPNAPAIKDMFDRAFGKPVQPVVMPGVENLSKHAQALMAEFLSEDPNDADDEEPNEE